jgi:hypothetical protein
MWTNRNIDITSPPTEDAVLDLAERKNVGADLVAHRVEKVRPVLQTTTQ